MLAKIRKWLYTIERRRTHMVPVRIILHHSLTKDSGTVSWRAIRRYHVETLGWDDIGYHAGIELVGDRYEILIGRLMNERGAHTEGYNTGSIGICFVGNFDVDEVPPEQWNLGVKYVASLCDTLKIPVNEIYGHRDFASKTCPGLKFNLDGFKQQVEERLR